MSRYPWQLLCCLVAASLLGIAALLTFFALVLETDPAMTHSRRGTTWHWFRCDLCRAVRQRYSQARYCGVILPGGRTCGGLLRRCNPPPAQALIGSPEWLEQRAMQHLIVRT